MCRYNRQVSMDELITQYREQILALAAEHGAFNVRVFGSVARGDDRPDSDIDILVDFEPGRDYFDQAGLLGDLRDLIGRPVDVIREPDLRERIKDEVLAQAIAI